MVYRQRQDFKRAPYSAYLARIGLRLYEYLFRRVGVTRALLQLILIWIGNCTVSQSYLKGLLFSHFASFSSPCLFLSCNSLKILEIFGDFSFELNAWKYFFEPISGVINKQQKIATSSQYIIYIYIYIYNIMQYRWTVTAKLFNC